MKIGGVRELTIPADKAYGDKAQGDKIPANSPLKFVVMAIEKPADIPEPEMPGSDETILSIARFQCLKMLLLLALVQAR